jgi:hypothetical protein
MNGHGFYKHSTGYIYDGLFENGLPNKLATKLIASLEGCNLNKAKKSYEIPEGSEFKFKVSVRAVNDNEEIFNGKEKNKFFGFI